MEPTNCPSCESDDIGFKAKSRLWKCDACNHEWTPTQELVPLRIFLSYGRDEFAAVAQKVHDDLVDRGHEVWFDINKLKEGGDWEQYIEDGLQWAAKEPTTGRIVFIMTPHSVRRPDGYCLNEIALGLSKNVSIVPVMLVWSEPPLSIYRLQFLDMRDTYRHDEKQFVDGIYDRKLERLAEALEHKKIDFQGSQSQLLKVLEPINFSADVFKLQKEFTGRQWVMDLVDRWLADPEGSKLFWITGAPGAGKSAIAAYLRDNRSQVAAFHFCDAASDEKRNPAKLVSSVACQLASQLPAYQERLSSLDLAGIKQEYCDPSKAYTLFDKLVVQPLAENFPEPDRTLVVIIDALDEATRSGKNEIVRFLAQSADKTPKWLRFLLTSRPDQEVLVPLQNYKPFVLDASGQENQVDLADYLKFKLPLVTQAQLHVILERSEGIFLYVKQACEDIARGNLSLDRLQEFPRGLGGIYEQFFERQFGADSDFYQREIVPLLHLVLAAQEPLTLAFLKAERGWANNNELFLRIDKLGSLFPRTGNADIDALRPFHKSVTDWLTVKANSGLWYVDVEWGHKLLAEAGWKQFQGEPEEMRPYFLWWLPEHLRMISNDERRVGLLKSFRFMMARLAHGALEQALVDYRRLESKLLPDLKYEQAFFRERTHILRRQNDEWPAHKILLQLAVEHADNSPLTKGAEAWLEAGRCNWEWIRRIQRVDMVGIDPCIAVLEGHEGPVAGVLERPDGSLVSWSFDFTLRLWSNKCDPLKVLEGHTHIINGALERRDGTLVSWSGDTTLRIWSGEGDLLNVLEGHIESVRSVIERRDGSLVSWSDYDSALRLWSPEGEALKVFDGHTGDVKGVLERRDGTLVSWAEDDNSMILWSNECDPLRVLDGHTAELNGILERADGILISWSKDMTLRLWSSEGESLRILPGHSWSVKGVLERCDGTLISWGDNSPRLWSGEGHLLRILEGHTSSVKGVLDLSDGRMVSWSDDCTLRIWSHDGSPLKVLEGHTSWVKGVIEQSNGFLASWSLDKTLRLWSTEGQPLKVLQGHITAAEKVLERRDGTLVSWAELEDSLRLWSAEGDMPNVLKAHTGKVKEALEQRDGSLLSWAEDDRSLQLWNSDGDKLKLLEGHAKRVAGVLMRSDGTLVSWSWDNALRLWDIKGEPLNVLKGHTRWVEGVIELRDGILVSWSKDLALRLWTSEGDPCQVLEGHTESVKGVLERLDGTLISWSSDNTLRLWSSRGEPLKVLEGHTAPVGGVLERHDGTLVSWAVGDSMRLWSNVGDPLNVLEGHTGSVRGVFERSDGTLASWGNRMARLWRADGAPLRILEGHSNRVNGLFERTDRTLVSWSDDGTLRLWSSEGEPQKVLEGHTRSVKGVFERPDGTLASWSWDKTLRLWSSSGDLLKVLTDHDGEHGYFQEEQTAPRRTRNHYLGASGRVCLTRFEDDEPIQKIAWQTFAESAARRLYPNGRMVVTQSDGQVCFLQLYRGNQPISLAYERLAI
jgi:WD40 repeat protein